MCDWQVGDLALCINQNAWNSLRLGGKAPKHFGPKPGSVHSVRGLRVQQTGELGLMFSDWPLRSFAARRFIKVTPPEGDAEDLETIKLLNGQPAEPVNQLVSQGK